MNKEEDLKIKGKSIEEICPRCKKGIIRTTNILEQLQTGIVYYCDNHCGYKA